MKKIIFLGVFAILFVGIGRRSCIDDGFEIRHWSDGSFSCHYYSICYDEDGERWEEEQLTDCSEISFPIFPLR